MRAVKGAQVFSHAGAHRSLTTLPEPVRRPCRLGVHVLACLVDRRHGMGELGLEDSLLDLADRIAVEHDLLCAGIIGCPHKMIDRDRPVLSGVFLMRYLLSW